jgi:hypothetical protein
VQQYLTTWDLVLTPIYLIVLGYFAKWQRDKKYPKGHPLRPYYLPGLWVKFGGVIFIALIYQYYYGGGDTYNYFLHAKIINSSLDDSITTWLKLILRTPVDSDPALYPYASRMEWYFDSASYPVASISAVLGLLNGTTYIPIALLFAYISYTGIWAMYKTFSAAYPHLIKQLAIAFLFVPSVFVWGSSIFKDTICMFGLGWMTYTTFRIFVNRDFSLKNFLLLTLSFYLVGIIKIYILLAFLPSLTLWLLLTYSHRIRISIIRYVMMIAAVGIIVLAFVTFSKEFSKELNRYSLERITKTLEDTRAWIVYSSGDEGSAYDIGTFEPTLTGIASKLPAGVSVTLFRPFIWEVRKPIQLLSSLEGLAFIILTLNVFFKRGFLNTFKLIFSSPNLVFFFTFSIIFAFAVGVSTGNFGTLSRYKIPCMPFFAALLIILIYQSKPVSKFKKKSPHNHAKPIHHFS